MTPRQLDRRTVIRLAAAAAALGAAPGALVRAAGALGVSTGAALMAPDPNGWRLLPGYTSRVVATSGQLVGGTGYVWHLAPDGAAVFPGADGGWTYVSNSERATPNGGVGMVRFSADGSIVDARSLMTGTDLNCSGGATPWGTWLSCEETSRGRVWEVDPTDAAPPVARPAMGRFVHEGAAVSTGWGAVYMTEDVPDGCLYRFRPTTWSDLSAGELSVLAQGPDGLRWSIVADPSAEPTATRFQVPTALHFNGGEGVAYAENTLFFTTKGDNRVWELDLATLALSVLYDATIEPTTALRGVDQMTITPWGDVLVVEDQGNMEVTLVTRSGQVNVIGQLPGVTGSELTGPAFDPSGARLYVTSQRNPGVTYEITGPFPPPVALPPEEPPPAPVPVVRFEEGAAGITFGGSWFVWSDGSQSGGAAMVGRGSSARVDVAFSGSVIRWIGQRGPARALGRVSVDGVVVETVDTYAAGYSSRQVLFERSGLAAGAHTLKIEFVGANPAATGWPALVFDAVEAEALGVALPPEEPPPAPVPVVRFEEGAAGITFGGSWFVWSDGSQSGGAAMVGRGSSARVDVAFSGSVIRWIGQRGPARALGRVSVDGVVVETVDTYAAGYSSRQVLFERSGLAAGAHTLKIEFVGANPAATGWPALVFDAVEAEALGVALPPEEPPPAPVPVVRFEEGAAGITFGGSWFVWSDGSQSGGAAMVGRGSSARVDVAFSGSVIRWIGQRGPARALGRVSVDGVVVETVDTYAAGYSSRQVLFERSGLAAGAHTLKIEFVGANPAATGWPALVFDAVEAEALA